MQTGTEDDMGLLACQHLKTANSLAAHPDATASHQEVAALKTHLDRIPLTDPSSQDLGDCLRRLVVAGVDRLPLPGNGRTADRWRALAYVAGCNLGLVKLFEGHTDALAIMTELDVPSTPPGSTWGMWAAESQRARATVARNSSGHVKLNGRKAWCSGAPVLSHALLTAWDEAQNQYLVAVALDQPGIRITSEGWQAIGMAATASVEVVFTDASGLIVGGPGAYLSRSGFWHGGAGIAACWYGAAAVIGEALRIKAPRGDDPHAMAHLGAVDAALASAAAVLRETAAAIDQDPHGDSSLLVRRARAAAESAVEAVIGHVGHALGAAPFCRDPHFARLMADLPVFVRQSHAERDLEVLGQAVAREQTGLWLL